MRIKIKLPPNETTALVLNPRGPRHGLRYPGPWGEPCAFQQFGLGSVTPESVSMIKLGNKSYDKLGYHLVRLTLLFFVLIFYFVVGTVVGIKTLIYIFIIKSVPYNHIMAEEVGFEPTVDFHLRRFSRPVHSTTLPLLRQEGEYWFLVMLSRG